MHISEVSNRIASAMEAVNLALPIGQVTVLFLGRCKFMTRGTRSFRVLAHTLVTKVSDIFRGWFVAGYCWWRLMCMARPIGRNEEWFSFLKAAHSG